MWIASIIVTIIGGFIFLLLLIFFCIFLNDREDVRGIVVGLIIMALFIIAGSIGISKAPDIKYTYSKNGEILFQETRNYYDAEDTDLMFFNDEGITITTEYIKE